MRFKILICLVISFVLMSFDMPKSIKKKVDSEIKSIFEISDFNLTPKRIEASDLKLPSEFNDSTFFEINSSNSILGYAYISKAPSKTDMFDYLVVLDENFVILSTKVLIYREDYGGEIGSKRWLKQFKGKTENDQLVYGDDIMAISGATISVKAMTNAVNDLLYSLKALHINKKL